MKESMKSQPAEPRVVSDLSDEVRVCDTCGDAGQEELLVLCNMCTDGAAHTYCMRVKLDKVPEGDWICEDCMLRIDTEKAVQDKVEEATGISKEHPEFQKSKSSSKLKFRSSSAVRRKREGDGVSFTPQLSATKYTAPFEVQSKKRARVVRMSAVPPRSFQPPNNSLPRKDILGKDLKKGKMKVAKVLTSMPEVSCSSQLVKFSHACGDEKYEGILEAELDKKTGALETRVVSRKASKPRKSKNLEKEKLESTNSATSMKRFSYITHGKAESSSIMGDKPSKLGSQIGVSQDKGPLLKSKSSNAEDLKLKGHLEKDSFLQKQKAATNGTNSNYVKGRDFVIVSKSLSLNNVSSDKSNDTESKLLLATASHSEALLKLSHAKEAKTWKRINIDREVVLAIASHPEALNKSSCAKEAKTTTMNETCDPHITDMCIQASDSCVISVNGDKEDKEMKSGNKTPLSYSNCHKLDAVQSCGQVDFKLKPGCSVTHKDFNCANEENRRLIHNLETLKEVDTHMEKHKLCIDLTREEISSGQNSDRYVADILFRDSIIPDPHHIWLGNFVTHSSQKPANFCGGVQAHLSTCASPKVLEMVDKFPDMIMLDELPRLRMWPSQFIESDPTEQNIALYFFAKDLNSYRTYYVKLLEHMTKNDLALKVDLGGIELLIFPSNVLPEKSQRWNQLLFLWGVFRGRKVINLANGQMTNSEKQENRDSERTQTWDLSANPQYEENIARDDEGGKCNNGAGEVHECDKTGIRPTKDGILLNGNEHSPGLSDPRQAVDKGENRSESEVVDVDVDLSLCPTSATPSDGFVENNNAYNGEPSGSSFDVQNLEEHEREAMEILASLSKGYQKVVFE